MSTDPDARNTLSMLRREHARDSAAGLLDADRARDVGHDHRAAADASAELARMRRLVHALERITTAVSGSASLEECLEQLLAAVAEIGRCEHAVLRLREGDQLIARVAIGLRAEVEAGFAHPVDVARGDTGARRPSSGELTLEDVRVSDAMRHAGMRTLYYLPCDDGEGLVAAIGLAWDTGVAPAPAEQDMLARLAPQLAAAIRHRLAHQALDQSVRARDQVLAVVAHDLRNPISVISMAGNTLLNKVSDSLARRPVERIIRAAQRADHLIEDLLQIDAIEGGRFSIQKRRVDPADVILAALESQQGLAASASVILATDLSPQLPQVEGDAERLLEVLENLIGNAIKFTNPGGSVTVGATGRQDEILLWVKDSGTGIAADQLPHLFDRFWQARKVDRRGTGLGLTICKAIVEAHGGRIWAESSLGVGTTMSFVVPAAAREQPTATDTQKASILLVDDRPENLLSLQAILDRPDYRLVCARSGEEALSLALREQFCVALIDIAMPGMNGLEVAVHLKELERSRNIPIIFITAFGDDPQEIHRAYSAGGVDYLVKPLDTEIVRKKVAVFVDLSHRRRQLDLPP